MEIDPAFVQDEEHRPKRSFGSYDSSANDQIPAIDLSPLQIDPPDEKSLESLVSQVGKACEEWGFFQVVNHGLPLHLLRNLESVANDFFALPLDEKRKIRRTVENPLGYYDSELTKNIRDWKEAFDFVVRGGIQFPAALEPDNDDSVTLSNRWPQNPPGFREACECFALAAEKLSFKLLALVSLSLGLPAARLNGYFVDNSSFVRLNCYPACPAPHLALGVGRHKDGGALTILYQDDVGGLEVRRKDGEWVGVEPVTDSFVVNLGDCMQVWSNDKYESVEHRVVANQTRRRLSIPFFFNPCHSVMVKPLEELLSEDNPPEYTEYNWGKYYKRRRDGNFKNLGSENLQIYHYKIKPILENR